MPLPPPPPIQKEDYSTVPKLKEPNIKLIVEENLRKSANWNGCNDRWDSIGQERAAKLLSINFWQDFGKQVVELIRSCCTGTRIKKLQKKLAHEEELLIQRFERTHKTRFIDDRENGFKRQLSEIKWQAVFGMLARTVLDMIKHDMCSNVSESRSVVVLNTTTSIVNSAFATKDKDIQSLFSHSHSHSHSPNMLKTIYYIASWHITACLKAAHLRKNSHLGESMMTLFENVTIDKEIPHDLPTEKVSQSEKYGGLKFVSSSYFDFILRLEYVFVKSLTSAKVAVLANSIVQRVYNDLNGSKDLRTHVMKLLCDDPGRASSEQCALEVKQYENIIDDLVHYLVRSYCRMRGLDFCREMMAASFSNDFGATYDEREEFGILDVISSNLVYQDVEENDSIDDDGDNDIY